ncbi:MAG: UvrD-helicase domain-containing protein, partial [Halanaerobiaceae bacterium]
MRKVLKASAGTGKTYSLSLEYILALLNGQSFEEILVMTFTRKATAEIRERIFEHLEELLAQGIESQVYLSIERKDPRIKLNLDKVKEIYQEMLKSKDKIHIYTIDSFINQIFKKSIAPYLGIFNYQIVEEEKNQEIIEEIFKEILDNPEDFALLEKFLSDNIERDIKNYLHLIGEVLKERWKFLLINKKKRSNRDCSQLVLKFDQSIRILESIAIEKGKNFLPDFIVKDFQTLITMYTGTENLQRKRNMIIKNYSLFFNNSFWNGNKVKGKGFVSLKEDLQEKYEEFLNELANYIYNEEIIPYEEEIFKFSSRIFEIADRLKFKLKAFTHSDISNYTYMYLDKNDLNLMDKNSFTAYFYELLGINIKSIFIDEFQDTSILQWKILKNLIDQASNVITVGDEKQSIYGWRGGEKELFAKLDRILATKTENLLTCYRSQKVILDFVNAFFSNIDIEWEYNNVNYLPAKDKGYLEILMGGESCRTNTESKTFAKYSLKKQEELIDINNRLVSDIKREIALRIKDLPDGSDIGVLARSNKQLSEIAMELDKEGIPYLLESKDSLLEHEAISPLFSLLSYLNYNDYFMLLKFLRSDLIGINNRSLRYLLENKKEVKDFLNDRIHEISFLEIEDILKEIKKIKGIDYQNLSNYIIEESAVIEKYRENSSALKNIYYFFQLMRNYNSLSEFMKYLDENKEGDQLKQLAVKEENAVKLMSIHKSKGLSFESEFFYWDPAPAKGGKSNKMEFYLSFDEEYQELEDYLLTNSRYEKLFDYLGIDFAEKKKERSLIEEINNIYVALTRAEKNLFFYIEGPRNLKKDKDGYCWQGSSYDFYEDALLLASNSISIADLIDRKEFGKLMPGQIQLIDGKVDLPDLKPYYSPLQLAAEKISRNKNKKDYQMNMDKEIKRIEGLAVHYYLENIKHDTETERRYAFQLMKGRYGNILGEKRINDISKRIVAFLEENSVFFNELWQVYNEYQLEYNEKKYRIDRLLVNEEKKEIIILDYKSGYLKDQAQLDLYKDIVERESKGKYHIYSKF